MKVVDSSGWLEYFADGPNADFFGTAIENPSELVIPTISIYEVFKRVIQQRTETEALQAIVAMQQGLVVDLSVTLALEAATLSQQLKLPMADSIMLATAQAYKAELWTQDIDFKGIEGVKCIEKQ
jgi:predicted nucleic acid-binding protein